MAKTKIAWTEFSWPVINGCQKVSDGCRSCYAARLAATRLMHTERYRGLAVYGEHGARWTGESRLDVKELEKPLRWRKPRRIFVCEMGDLFYERNTSEQIAAVFGVMAACPQHTFQIVTKRPQRMLEFLRKWSDVEPYDADPVLAHGPAAVRAAHTSGRARLFADMIEGWGSPPDGAAYPTYDWARGMRWWPTVLPNVWLGVSVEDQERADERIPLLLQVPASVRFASCEPLIERIDFSKVPGFNRMGLDLSVWWVIVGGESGPNARPCNVEWIRSIVRQCKAARVPVFVKQMGANYCDAANGIGGRYTKQPDTIPPIRRLKDRSGADPAEWPEDLRIREYPEVRHA